jgi:hypothetical protein
MMKATPTANPFIQLSDTHHHIKAANNLSPKGGASNLFFKKHNIPGGGVTSANSYQ